MKLYIGSRDYKPEGYLTVDIDPGNRPDIVADATNLTTIASNSVDEVIASHVLEHIPYPRSFAALGEWARVLKVGGVLKVAVPDLKLLCSMVMRGLNLYQAVGLMYGAGRVDNVYEAHQWGYTREMLLEMFAVLGFAEFSDWSSPVHDASNGWMWADSDDRLGISLNLAGTKRRAPFVDVQRATEVIRQKMEAPFLTCIREVASASGSPLPDPQLDAELYQKLHRELVDARLRIKHLEATAAAAPLPQAAVGTRFHQLVDAVKKLLSPS
jgi:predicted SAM-dependent methyltransferase